MIDRICEVNSIRTEGRPCYFRRRRDGRSSLARGTDFLGFRGRKKVTSGIPTLRRRKGKKSFHWEKPKSRLGAHAERNRSTRFLKRRLHHDATVQHGRSLSLSSRYSYGCTAGQRVAAEEAKVAPAWLLGQAERYRVAVIESLKIMAISSQRHEIGQSIWHFRTGGGPSHWTSCSTRY